MKEQIYTIPVNDGFNEGGECPFCNMYNKLEKENLDYMLGSSYMDDNIRMETDKIGFCKNHYSMMYNKQNRLGLALMLQSHIQKINSDIENLSNSLNCHKKKGLFSKTPENKVTPYINNISESCYICNKIKTSMDRYFDTFFYMWKKDNELKEKVKNSKGFCINHFATLVDMANKKLNNAEYKDFINIITPLELENIKRLESEINHFINKFDHNYKDAPWGTAKDALPRGIEKISSQKLEE